MKILLLLVITLLYSCSDDGPGQSLPNGVKIHPAPGVIVNDAAINEGLNIAISKARCHGYTRGIALSEYTIEVAQGEMYNGVAVLRLPRGAYCGGAFDQGGFIYASGQFIEPRTIRIPSTANAVAIEYEAEHFVLYLNDRPRYEQTKVHGLGTGHPILACNEQ